MLSSFADSTTCVLLAQICTLIVGRNPHPVDVDRISVFGPFVELTIVIALFFNNPKTVTDVAVNLGSGIVAGRITIVIGRSLATVVGLSLSTIVVGILRVVVLAGGILIIFHPFSGLAGVGGLVVFHEPDGAFGGLCAKTQFVEGLDFEIGSDGFAVCAAGAVVATGGKAHQEGSGNEGYSDVELFFHGIFSKVDKFVKNVRKINSFVKLF